MTGIELSASVQRVQPVLIAGRFGSRVIKMKESARDDAEAAAVLGVDASDIVTPLVCPNGAGGDR